MLVPSLNSIETGSKEKLKVKGHESTTRNNDTTIDYRHPPPATHTHQVDHTSSRAVRGEVSCHRFWKVRPLEGVHINRIQ